MTKLGTPIGAGPKGAIVVVGLAVVGVPPAEYCEPPSPPPGAAWSPPPFALGAVAAAAAGVLEAFVAVDPVLAGGAVADDSRPLLDAVLVGGRRRLRHGLRVGSSFGRLARSRRFRRLVGVGRRFAVGVEFVDQAVAVVVEA